MEFNESQSIIIAKSIVHYGDDMNKAVACEEAAELIDVLNKERRNRVGIKDIITEIADVIIVCEKLSHIYGYDEVKQEVDRKLNRLNDKIDKNQL